MNVLTLSRTEQVFHRYADLLRRYARKLVGATSADDLFQDVFERFVRQEHSGRPVGEHVLPWLLHVMRNLAIDEYRRNDRILRRGIQTLSTDAPAAGPSSRFENTEDLLLREAVYNRMRAVAACLDAAGRVRYRRLLELLLVGRVAQDEIGRQLGVSVRTVRRMIEKLFHDIAADLKKFGVTSDFFG